MSAQSMRTTATPAFGAALPAYDAIATRACHRVTVMYGIEHQSVPLSALVDVAPIWECLKLDRLESAFRSSARQFPRVVGSWAVGDVEFTHAQCEVSAARMWLFALPNGALVMSLTVETECDEAGVISLLEDLHHRRLTVGGMSPWQKLCALAPEWLQPHLADGAFAIETYNLLHLSEKFWEAIGASGDVNVRLVSSLIYRFQENYETLSPRIELPHESNRGAAFAATGPYVGVTVRTQGYVENAMFISCLLFVGALATLRNVRDQSFRELQRARAYLDQTTLPWTPRTQRDLLGISSQNLARLQLELSCGVEAFERVASTVPSLRVTDYHESLFRSAHIAEETSTIAMILERLTAALRAETVRRQSAERQTDERRSVIRSVSFGLITTIALPLGIIFGFFGMSSNDIHANDSILDLHAYGVFYLLFAAMIVGAVVVAVGLYLKFRREERRSLQKLTEALAVDF